MREPLTKLEKELASDLIKSNDLAIQRVKAIAKALKAIDSGNTKEARAILWAQM